MISVWSAAGGTQDMSSTPHKIIPWQVSQLLHILSNVVGCNLGVDEFSQFFLRAAQDFVHRAYSIEMSLHRRTKRRNSVTRIGHLARLEDVLLQVRNTCIFAIFRKETADHNFRQGDQRRIEDIGVAGKVEDLAVSEKGRKRGLEVVDIDLRNILRSVT
jgi:hypothetical protein